MADLQHTLRTITPGGPSALQIVISELKDLLCAENAVAFRAGPTNIGWALDFCHWADPRGGVERAHAAYVAGAPSTQSFAAYDPLIIQRNQRNVAMSLSELKRACAWTDETCEAIYGGLGLRGRDQIRVLVCEGPRLLSWVGALRPEPFGSREVRILEALTPALVERLRLERRLAMPALSGAVMEAAFEAIPSSVFVLGPRDTVEYANALGLLLLDKDPQGVIDSICANHRVGTNAGAYSVTHLDIPGLPGYRLAVQLMRPRPSEGRFAAAKDAWQLTPRQAEVLALLARGQTNKEIALELGCVEVTVELHVSALFRKSGATNRTELVAMLLSESLRMTQ